MKTLLPALVLLSALAQAQQPPVYVRGAGEKWYSARDLERVAREYVKERKMDFALEGKPIVWVNTSGSNVMASVSFAAGVGSGIVVVDIDPHGKVITNHMSQPAQRDPRSPELVYPGKTNISRTNRVQRSPR